RLILNGYTLACYSVAGGVLVKLAQSVFLLSAWAALLACATPAKEHPLGPTAPLSGAPPTAPAPALTSVSATAAAPAPTEPGASASAAPNSKTGSAYFGCGQPIPPAKLW